LPDRSLIYDHDEMTRLSPVKVFIAGRGCPYRCTYCFNHAWYSTHYPHEKRGYMRPVDSVIAEAVWVRERYPLEQVIFVDDLFIVYYKNGRFWFPSVVHAGLLPVSVQSCGTGFSAFLLWAGFTAGWKAYPTVVATCAPTNIECVLHLELLNCDRAHVTARIIEPFPCYLLLILICRRRFTARQKNSHLYCSQGVNCTLHMVVFS
jgi:hypothetical protein